MGNLADGFPPGVAEPARWPDEPNIPRVSRGEKDRVNKLKSLGNAVVPQVVEVIGRAIMEAHVYTNVPEDRP
jgi:hypothetical protein